MTVDEHRHRGTEIVAVGQTGFEYGLHLRERGVSVARRCTGHRPK